MIYQSHGVSGNDRPNKTGRSGDSDDSGVRKKGEESSNDCEVWWVV